MLPTIPTVHHQAERRLYLGHSNKYLLCSLHSILFQVLLVPTVHSEPIPGDSHAYTQCCATIYT